MRGADSLTLPKTPTIDVVGEAADPLEAREAIKALIPDVMTLDVQMPKMDGLEFLEKVMRLRPFPVVMVSAQTARGAAATIGALELGAVNCVGKPRAQHPISFAELPAQGEVAAPARASQAQRAGGAPRAAPISRPPTSPTAGSSRSARRPEGSRRWCRSSRGFPRIARRRSSPHMPSPFHKSFAKRLDGL